MVSIGSGDEQVPSSFTLSEAHLELFEKTPGFRGEVARAACPDGCAVRRGVLSRHKAGQPSFSYSQQRVLNRQPLGIETRHVVPMSSWADLLDEFRESTTRRGLDSLNGSKIASTRGIRTERATSSIASMRLFGYHPSAKRLNHQRNAPPAGPTTTPLSR